MSTLIVGEYNSTPPSVGTGQKAILQADPQGRLITRGTAFISTFSITRTADTTTYNGNDVIGPNNGGSPGAAAFELTNIGPPGGGYVLLTSTRFEIDVASVPSGMTSFKLALFSVTPPSALLDNDNWTYPSGDRASCRGFLDLGVPVDLGSTMFVESPSPINKQVYVPSGGSLFAYLITATGFTPGSGDVFSGVVQSVLVG